MSRVIDTLERAQMRRVPGFESGDRLRVHFQVVEGSRRRTQVFEGVVIRRQGQGVRETFTVRKQSFGVGVERTFPVHSPKIERIEIASRGQVRRAKLYYLRDRVGRGARVRERRYLGEEQFDEAGAMPTDEEALRPGEEELAAEVDADRATEPEGAEGEDGEGTAGAGAAGGGEGAETGGDGADAGGEGAQRADPGPAAAETAAGPQGDAADSPAGEEPAPEESAS